MEQFKVAFEYKDPGDNMFSRTFRKNTLHNDDLNILHRAFIVCGFPWRDWHYTTRDGKEVSGFTVYDYNTWEFERQCYIAGEDDILGLLHGVLSIDDILEMVCKRGRFIRELRKQRRTPMFGM